MISHFRKFIALLLILLLTLSLSGCDSLTYREAINLYNDQEYDQAAELFSQLGEYEDSKALFQRSRYYEAVKLMEQGDYSAAQPRFIKLGDYEDSAQRLLECRYQLALVAFNEGDYDRAEQEFLEFPEYRQTPEYLRQINWLKFYHYVLETGTEEDGCRVISATQEDRTVKVFVDQAEPDRLFFSAVWEKDLGYTFRDNLKISVTRDSFDGVFSASSSFTMDFNGKEIGSVQTAEGQFSVTDCTADMTLIVETFSKTVTDNQGKVTDSTDPMDATMFEAMQENYAAIMAVFPQVVADSALGITPADMGFENLT